MITPDLGLARRFADQHGVPQPLVLGVTGSHSYGFPSADSDLDLKGIHIAPTADLVSLAPPSDTVDVTTVFDGVEIDYTSHELGFALRLLLKGNGNMLERTLSPYQVVRSARQDALAALTRGAVCKRFYRHYRGFFGRIQQDCLKTAQPTAKDYLYAYRSALTGIHLLRAGECVMDVEVLAREYGFQAVPELLEHKRAAGEFTPAPAAVPYAEDWPRLEALLDDAHQSSALPESSPNVGALSDFLIEERRRNF